MTETLFNQQMQVRLKGRDCDQRRAEIRASIEQQQSSLNPGRSRDLLVRLTDDSDPCFLYNLTVSEEDFQSLKVQQGLLVDFASFPQKFIDLLNQCISEQDKDCPRFLLELSCPDLASSSSASLNVVEANAFKHLTHLSLKLLHGTDKEVKKYLAARLSSVQGERRLLEQRLKKTEDDLSRQLSYAQQTLSEKSRELDKLRSEWTSQTSSLSGRHSQELAAEREKALETQTALLQRSEDLRRDLEGAHARAAQQLRDKLAEAEAAVRDLTEKRYEGEAAARDLRSKLAAAEEEAGRAKQQAAALRRENAALDAECHEKERLVNQLRTRGAVLEQETRDQAELMLRTKEVLGATQEQKSSAEEAAAGRQAQAGKLEAAVRSLSEELIKANAIIRKLQAELRALAAKMKLKNAVTVSQEKALAETAAGLRRAEAELAEARRRLEARDAEAEEARGRLEAAVRKLDESREVLRTNENVIGWLNKQLNQKQLGGGAEGAGPGGDGGGVVRFNPAGAKPRASPAGGAELLLRPAPASNKENGGEEPVGLESKYLERRDDSIPLRGLLAKYHPQEAPRPAPPKPSLPSAYFSGRDARS